MKIDIQCEAALDAELETLWYLGGLRIIQACETQTKQAGAIFECLEPSETSTFSYAPSPEDVAIYLVEGEAIFLSGEATIHATPGSFVFLPRPIAFRSVVSSSGPARMLTWTTPMGFAHQVMCMGEPGQPLVLLSPHGLEQEKIHQFASLLLPERSIEPRRQPQDHLGSPSATSWLSMKCMVEDTL